MNALKGLVLRPLSALARGLVLACLLGGVPQASLHAGAPATKGSKATTPLPATSLYHLKLDLTDQAGKKHALDRYKGSPVIITLFYATCPAACPLLIHDIQAIEKKLPPEVRAKTRILMVSMDPERDTPKTLTTLAEKHGMDLSRWTLAAAPDAQVRELAAVLGVKYRRLSDGNFNHTSLITLLSPQGEPLERLEGAMQPSENLIARLKTLLP